MPAWSLDTFFLNHIGRCGLVLLLGARLLVGWFFFTHLVVVELRPCWMKSWSLDDFLLNHISWCDLVFILDAGLVIGYILLNHIGRCGLVSLLDGSLVIGWFLFLITWSLWPCVPVEWKPGHWIHFFLITLFVVALCLCWMQACSLDDYFLNRIGCCGQGFLLDESLVIGYLFS